MTLFLCHFTVFWSFEIVHDLQLDDSHVSPSYKPSPDTAQDGCTYQFLSRNRVRPSFSCISCGFMAEKTSDTLPMIHTSRKPYMCCILKYAKNFAHRETVLLLVIVSSHNSNINIFLDISYINYGSVVVLSSKLHVVNGISYLEEDPVC